MIKVSTAGTTFEINMRRETRRGPHEWTVEIKLPGSRKTVEVGKLFQHSSGHPDNSNSVCGYEARLTLPGEDREVDPPSLPEGVERVDGLGFATYHGAAKVLAREAANVMLREWPERAGAPIDPAGSDQWARGRGLSD